MKKSRATASEIHRALYSRVGQKQHVETDLVKATLDYLGALRIKAFRRNIGGIETLNEKGRKRYVAFNQAGMSDVWGIAPGGLHIEIELKAPGKEPTPHQRAWLTFVRSIGGIAIWADSIEDVMAKLQNALAEHRTTG